MPRHPWGNRDEQARLQSRSLDSPAASARCQGTVTIARRLPSPSALPGDGQDKGGRAGVRNAPRVPSKLRINCARGTPSSTLGGAEFILCDAANRGEDGRPQPKGEEGEDKRPPPAPITISGGVGGRDSRGLLGAGL